MVGERASINFRLFASFKKGGKKLSKQTKSKGKRHARYDYSDNFNFLPNLNSRKKMFFGGGAKSLDVMILPHLKPQSTRFSKNRSVKNLNKNFYY